MDRRQSRPRNWIARLVAAMLLGALLPRPTGAQAPVITEYLAATKAREGGDAEGYLRHMQSALQLAPGHAILLRHIAQAYALRGDLDRSVQTLGRVAATGAYFDPAAYEDLAPLSETEGFGEVARQLRANLQPRGHLEVVAEIDDPLLIPEGVAWDPQTRSFFVSSVAQRKIVRVDSRGQTSDFAGNDPNFYCGLGLEVDAGRRHLWAASAWFEDLGLPDETTGRSSLSCFDVDTQERLGTFAVEASAGAPRNLNDLCVDADGRVYVTEAIGGALYVLDPGAPDLVALLAPGSLSGPNGIALDEPRGTLYVSQYNLDIVRVDIDTGEISTLDRPDDVALYGVDGLYLHDGALVAIQNHPSLQRVSRFFLSPDGKRVLRGETLARRHELLEEPTTGVVVGGSLVFLGNSQIERFLQATKPADPKAFQPARLLRVRL